MSIILAGAWNAFVAILPVVIWALDQAVFLAGTAFVTLGSNMEITARQLANGNLLRFRVESNLEPIVWRGTYLIVWATFVLGWIILAHITVWTWNLVWWWMFWRILKTEMLEWKTAFLHQGNREYEGAH